MADPAYIFVLALGLAVFLGAFMVARITAIRGEERRIIRFAHKALQSEREAVMAEEPELDLGDKPTANDQTETAQRRVLEGARR